MTKRNYGIFIWPPVTNHSICLDINFYLFHFFCCSHVMTFIKVPFDGCLYVRSFSITRSCKNNCGDKITYSQSSNWGNFKGSYQNKIFISMDIKNSKFKTNVTCLSLIWHHSTFRYFFSNYETLKASFLVLIWILASKQHDN